MRKKNDLPLLCQIKTPQIGYGAIVIGIRFVGLVEIHDLDLPDGDELSSVFRWWFAQNLSNVTIPLAERSM